MLILTNAAGYAFDIQKAVRMSNKDVLGRFELDGPPAEVQVPILRHDTVSRPFFTGSELSQL